MNVSPELKDALEVIIATQQNNAAVYNEETFRNHPSLADWSTEQIDEHIRKSNEEDALTYKAGKKYIKLTQGKGSVVAFIDEDGNVYKPASWRAPAPHIRGNILSDHPMKAFYSFGGTMGVKSLR